MDNKIYRIISIGTEVTEAVNARKLIEASKKRSEKERKLLHDFFTQAPAMLAILKGSDYVFEFANPAYLELIGNRNIIDKTLLEALPEVAGQGFVELLDNVYNTGETFIGKEMPVMVDKGNGKHEQFYVNFTYQAFTNDKGEREGILVFAYDVTEQVETRKQIEASEKRFSNMLMQSLMGICIFEGPEMVVAFANEPMLKMWGKGNVIGKSLLEFLPEVKDQPFPKLLLDVYTTGVAFATNEIKAIINRNGKEEECYFNLIYQPYRDVDDTITGITVLATEMTGSVFAKRQIEASEKRFSNILSQSIMAIGILKGTDMIVTFANDPLLASWGKGENIIGKPLLEVMPEIEDQGFPQLLQQVYTTGVPYYGYETKVTLIRNGKEEPVYYNFVYQPYTEVDNSITGITILATEVTEQVLAKKQIEESEQKFRGLFESMDQGVCIIEMIFDGENKPLDYLILECNPVFSQQTGLQNVINKTAKELMPDLDNFWFDTYGKVALTQQPIRFSQKADILGRWFDVYAFPFENKGSNKVAIVFTNITERKKIEEQIAENEKQLEKKVFERTEELAIKTKQLGQMNQTLELKNFELENANAELKSFTYIASHDLQELLRKIQMFSKRIIEVEIFSDKTQDYFNRIIASSERMQDLIVSLLDFPVPIQPS
ncbi:MAG: PAS domain-containing protein [Cyclobacteriaceae bacterium]